MSVACSPSRVPLASKEISNRGSPPGVARTRVPVTCPISSPRFSPSIPNPPFQPQSVAPPRVGAGADPCQRPVLPITEVPDKALLLRRYAEGLIAAQSGDVGEAERAIVLGGTGRHGGGPRPGRRRRRRGAGRAPTLHLAPFGDRRPRAPRRPAPARGPGLRRSAAPLAGRLGCAPARRSQDDQEPAGGNGAGDRSHEPGRQGRALAPLLGGIARDRL